MKEKKIIMKEEIEKEQVKPEDVLDRYIRFDWAIKVRHEVLILIV